MTKNCKNIVIVTEETLKDVKNIIDNLGKVNIVFPAYKLAKEELKSSYRLFAEAMARKNLQSYDSLSSRNKRTVELYELVCAVYNVAENLLEEVKTIAKGKSFLTAACIL